jgi:hypothetical protein
MTAATVIGAVAIGPAQASVDLTRSAPSDTQLLAERIVDSLDGPTAWTRQLKLRKKRAWVDLAAQPIKVIEDELQFLVVNELFAQQYIRSMTLSGQSESIRRIGRAYAVLLKRPALMITSRVGSFAFRNVPYRIIALRGDPHSLAIAVTHIGSFPDIELRLMPGEVGHSQ